MWFSTDAEQNMLYFVHDDIVFAFDHKSRKSSPVIILANWIQENKNNILARLKVFETAVEIRDCFCVDDEGKEIPEPLVFIFYYDPITGCINADTPNTKWPPLHMQRRIDRRRL
jgi:hypothetical protein